MEKSEYDKRLELALKLVLRASGGALAVSLRRAAQLLGLSSRTLYNRHNQGKLPPELQPLPALRPRIYFDAVGIASLLSASPKAAARGAPTKVERIEAARAGVSVAEFRRRKMTNK